jgi:hypothetical protein
MHMNGTGLPSERRSRSAWIVRSVAALWLACAVGGQAVPLARSAHPNQILMDLGLGDREVAMTAGSDDFDTKPIRFERQLDKIETLLAKGAITQ